MIAQLGRMGGKLAWGDVAGVTTLEDGAAIFARGRVPVTRAARLSKIKVFTQGEGAKRRITVDSRPGRACLSRIQAAFMAEVAAGRDTWLAFTIMFDHALGVRIDDFEGDFIRARALSIIRKRSARIGAWHSIIWTMERDRHRGLHLHGLGHATSDTNCQMREVIREGFGSACETDLRAPALKFHTPIHRVAGPSEAGGWLAYSLSGLVAPGIEVSGIRGKPGCAALTIKPAGISKARGHG